MGHRGFYKQRKLRVSECREKVYFYYDEQEQLGRSQQSTRMPHIRYSRSSSKHLLIFSLRYSRRDTTRFCNVIPIRSEGSKQHKLGACSKLLGVIYRRSLNLIDVFTSFLCRQKGAKTSAHMVAFLRKT